MDSADGLKAALENDAVTDIEVVGSFAYDDSIPQEKNITIKSSMTLTLQYSSGFYTPYGATVCNSNIRVEQGGTICLYGYLLVVLQQPQPPQLPADERSLYAGGRRICYCKE